MSWATTITYDDVRAECVLITVALKGNTVVTADIAKSEDWINAMLRNKYVITNPGADATCLRALLVYTVYKELVSIYGNEGYDPKAGGLIQGYYEEWKAFEDSIKAGTLVLSLEQSSTCGLPEITNFNKGSESSYSNFDLDTNHDEGFPLHVADT